MVPKCLRVTPMARIRATQRREKPASLRGIQSAFERIWLEAKKRLPEYMAKKPSNTALRSQYALRLYGWAKKHVEAGTTSISLEDLRKVLGLESVKDTDGNVIKEPPLPIWANFRQRALDVAILGINNNISKRLVHSPVIGLGDGHHTSVHGGGLKATFFCLVERNRSFR